MKKGQNFEIPNFSDSDNQDDVMEVDEENNMNKFNSVPPGDIIETKAFRSFNKKHNPADLSFYSKIIQHLIISLTNLTKIKVEEFYFKQYAEVKDILKRAYTQGQNNSFLLLSRSKQTLHSFISCITSDVLSQMKEWDPQNELKVIRVNSILSNSEAKILAKLCESLSLKHASQAFHSLEMMNHIKEYFDNNPRISVCFILEDIDYYVETTKQVLLYKILDMFGYLAIKFVFIATSVKIDIADSFEKRIKSRFSHRMILFYEQSMDLFRKNIYGIFNDLLFEADQEQRNQINIIAQIVQSEKTFEVLDDEFQFGKNYEYLAQILRITLSSLDQIITQKMLAPEFDQVQQNEVDDFLQSSFQDQLKNFTQLKQNSEPIKVFEKMTKASLIVLIAAKKVAERANIFNFDAVYNKYRNFTKNHESVGLNLSKQVFLKTFLDLVHNGFIKSESETDLLNVNNKISLGFLQKDLNKMLIDCKGKLQLPQQVEKWALMEI